jgi:hypothetical protein
MDLTTITKTPDLICAWRRLDGQVAARQFHEDSNQRLACDYPFEGTARASSINDSALEPSRGQLDQRPRTKVQFHGARQPPILRQ